MSLRDQLCQSNWLSFSYIFNLSLNNRYFPAHILSNFCPSPSRSSQNCLTTAGGSEGSCLLLIVSIPLLLSYYERHLNFFINLLPKVRPADVVFYIFKAWKKIQQTKMRANEILKLREGKFVFLYTFFVFEKDFM
jgi:hypothetical protein